MGPFDVLWILLVLALLQPAVARTWIVRARRRALARLAKQRDATVITLIHRQETISLLGVPLMRQIDVDDAEGVLQAIRETPDGRPIEIVLHTPGGLVLAATQIAQALADHDGKVTAVVPHYAMSGGTLIALAADEIVLDPHAALGPIDPQLGQWPAASIVAAVDRPGQHQDDTLILADIARKALRQVEELATRLLARHLPPEKAREAAITLSTGQWTHDYPLLSHDLEPLGLPVRLGVPREERELFSLYPQPRGRQSVVEYFPGRPAPPGMPTRRELPRPKRAPTAKR